MVPSRLAVVPKPDSEIFSADAAGKTCSQHACSTKGWPQGVRAEQPTFELHDRGFKELGWVEGHNFHFDHRWAREDAARAKAEAASLVNQKPDVIVANSTLSLAATESEATTIPIVFRLVLFPHGIRLFRRTDGQYKCGLSNLLSFRLIRVGNRQSHGSFLARL